MIERGLAVAGLALAYTGVLQCQRAAWVVLGLAGVPSWTADQALLGGGTGPRRGCLDLACGTARGAGDLLVAVNGTVPKGLSAKERKLVEALAETMPESPRPSLDV